MRKQPSSFKNSSILPCLAALAFTVSQGCGSNQPSSADAATIGPADGAVALTEDASVAGTEAGPVDSGALGEAGQSREAGLSATAYCTNKLALSAAIDVSGTWVMRVLATQVVNAPIVGALHPKTLFYMLVDLTQSGAGVAANGRYCDRAEIDPPGSLATVVIPDKWAHTEKVVNRQAQWSMTGEGLPLLTFPTLIEWAGAIPTSSASEALPTSPTDPRVIDEDNDGNPGITVNLTGGFFNGSLYSVQRQTTAIRAVPVAADRLEGILDFGSEQNVIGSNPSSLATLYGQASTAPDPTPCSTTFAMVKVGATASDGSPVSCTWVRANESVLFPQ